MAKNKAVNPNACVVCGKPLRSRKSIDLGYGPVCAKKEGKSLSILGSRNAKGKGPYGLVVNYDIWAPANPKESLESKYIMGVDPAPGVVDAESRQAEVFNLCTEYNGKAVELRYKFSEGEVTRRGRLVYERELILLYKGRNSGKDYDFLLDVKYFYGRVLDIKPLVNEK